MAIFTGQFHSLTRNRQVSFSAVIPVDVFGENGIEHIGGPFPTLYLLHGYAANHMSWIHNSNIEELAAVHRIAVIMPDCGNSFYLNNRYSCERYADYIGKELVDVTRKLFPLSHEREKTWIGGLSMGGFGAIRNGLYYNDVFGAAIGLSSALITDEVAAMQPGKGNAVAPYEYYVNTFGEPAELLASDRAPKTLAKTRAEEGAILPRLFLACGTEDFLYRENLDMHQYLESLGIEHEWLTHPGVHDYRFWNYALPLALDWVRGKGMKQE